MKNFILIIITLCFAQVLQAQITAAEYMKKAPAIPEDLCKTKTGIQDAFEKSLRELSFLIHEDAQNRSRKTEEYMQGNEEQMRANMMKKSGMSDEDMKRMQNGHEMTDAETQAMANKMMQQQTGISLDEAKNMSNMSEAEKEAWAQGYAAEQKSENQANPGMYKDANETNMTLYELLSEQTFLQNKVSEMENQLKKQYMALDKTAKNGKAALDVELKPLFDELNSINDGEGSTQADVEHADRVIKKIRARQDAYCEKYTPGLRVFILECKEAYSQALPDYERIEEIQFQVTAIQTNTPLITTGKGMYSIQAVEQYLKYLAYAYRYKLYRAE